MLSPRLPDYDVAEWERRPFPERLRMVCQAWAEQGYGTPPVVYVAYLAKIGLYVAGWAAFVASTPGVDGGIGSWWASDVAFQKAILWTILFEALGLGCGSGPLTGRYFPPMGGVLYFLRPGTTKLPLVPGLPVLGRSTRSWVDVVLNVALYGLLLRGLLAPEIGAAQVVPVVVVLVLVGLADKTAFLATRPDHYLIVLIAFAFTDWLPATKLIWVAIWWWAATSKLNRHFPSVVAVMVSNSPTIRSRTFKRAMYRRFPDDLRPSRLAAAMAHGGTVIEYLFPLGLLLGRGGTLTVVALAVMVAFHLFITSSIPMGVPIEWNVMMVYGGFVLFGVNAPVRAWEVSSPPLVAFLVLFLLVVPVVGNLWPRYVSFLMSMRYYAGNWAYSVWLFRRGTSAKLDEGLVKTSPGLRAQLGRMYDEVTTTGLLSKVMAFRAMHLHGRALQVLVPRAVEDIDDYEWLDGELVAGMVVGWNFGEGHLHDERLLASVQSQCGFAPGELRCIFVESQPMGKGTMHWRIWDAAEGRLAEGRISVRELAELQPWPEGT